MAIESARVATWDGGDWREASACRAYRPELFFPVGVTGEAEVQTERAKAVCAGCPVRDECLVFAITTNQEYGIWGGATEDERRAIRRQWRASRRRAQLAAS